MDLLRFVVGIVILGVGAYTDLKSRSASNKLWIILGSIASIILVIDFYIYGINIIKIVLMLFMIILAYVLFQLRLISGGADAKAIMSLSILFPLFVFDVWFIACIVSLLSIPFIVLFKGIPFKDVLVGYSFPFLVSLFVSFLIMFPLFFYMDLSIIHFFVMYFI